MKKPALAVSSRAETLWKKTAVLGGTIFSLVAQVR
jgi:hypothetical protein